MPQRPPERPWGLVVGDVVFIAVVALATVPAYVFVEASWRPLVVRLAAALVLGVLLLQVKNAVLERVTRDRPSAFETAAITPTVESRVDSHLVNLETAVRASVRDRRSFERMLWPRLCAFARAPLTAPAPRRFGRGPSLDDVRTVVETLERGQS